MALKSYFTISVNDLPVIKEYDHYPSEEEIEEEINKRFPDGFIYDQYAGKNIYPIAKVNKIYKLAIEGGNSNE